MLYSVILCNPELDSVQENYPLDPLRLPSSQWLRKAVPFASNTGAERNLREAMFPFMIRVLERRRSGTNPIHPLRGNRHGIEVCSP